MVSIRLYVFPIFAALAFGQAPSQLAETFPAATPPRTTPVVHKLTPEQKGDVFMARKMYREAIDAYQDGGAKSAVLANKIGIAYHQLGDFRAARKNYERAMKLDRKYPDAVNNDGTVFYAMKNYRGAISRYRRAIQLAPETASFWSNLGTAWYARGRFKEMNEAYQKALELDPEIFEHHGTVGTELQDRTVADRARFHYELARLYAQKGKNELALQYLRKAIEEGLKDRTKMVKAPEFAALQENEEFKILVALQPRVL